VERSEWISAISEALQVAKEKAAKDLLGKSAIEHWRCRLGLVINSQHFQVKTQEGWCERKRVSGLLFDLDSVTQQDSNVCQCVH
jgi:hypothetical protein